jgi:hypothetical protein
VVAQVASCACHENASQRASRDNMANPIIARDPYRPVNAAAIGDLMSLFSFAQ